MQYGSSQAGNVEYGGVIGGTLTVYTKTLDGVAIIQVTTTQTITGRANIAAPPIYQKDIYGVAAITFQPVKTIDGKARVVMVRDKVLTGKTRISKTNTYTLDGKAYIDTGSQRTQTLDGVGKISATMTQTLNGKARVTFPGTDWNRVGKPTGMTWHPITNVDRTSTIWNPVDKALINH